MSATMLTRVMQGDDPDVLGPRHRIDKWSTLFRDNFGAVLQRMFGHKDGNTLSLNVLPSNWSALINGMDVDVVNLQWVGQETMSIRDIGNIRKPVVWTSQDLWPIAGAKHYEYDYPDVRNLPFASPALGASGEKSWFDADGWVRDRKVRAWGHRMSVVCPSRWLAGRARASEVARHWSVEVIPNVVDTTLFKPLPRDFCRAIFNIGSTKKILTCGAYNLLTDSRKGSDLFVRMLEQLALSPKAAEIEVCIFGQAERAGNPRLPFRTHWIPRIYDQQTLALIYNLSDVVVVPSREDNLPQVATEAQACGIPVIGFEICGMPDAVEHMQTGYLAKPFDVAEMAHGVGWLLESDERYRTASVQSRTRAVDLWAPEAVIPQYKKIFEEAISRSKSIPPPDAKP
ncbi:MAG: glycosyltransferase [Betaproteobacteria bacterium]